MDLAIAVAGVGRDEVLKRAVDSLSELIREAEDVTLEKESIRRFTQYISRLRTILRELGAKQLDETPAVKDALQMLEADVGKARDLIRSYNSGSQLHLLLNCSTMLSQLQHSAAEIARGLQLFHLANLDATLHLDSRMDSLIRGLESLQFTAAVNTEALVSDIQKSLWQNGRDGEQTMKVLRQIAEAVGACPDASHVRRQVELLRREKEELEERNQQAEALQLLQLTNLLRGLDTTPTREPPESSSEHSFERKQRKEQEKLQNAVSSVTSGEPLVLHQSLEDLCTAMEDTGCIDHIVDQQGLVSNLVGLLRMGANDVNAKAALRCLCYLGHHSQENKEVIAKSGGIRYIVKQLCMGEVSVEAMEVLLELSHIQALAERIGHTTDSIPSLVSLLQNPNPDISQKAQKVLDNISFNTEFVIKMAECRHLDPFLSHFHKGHLVTRASMATALTKMQLSERSAQHFESEQFISELSKTVYSTTPNWKSQCLCCIKKLTTFNRLAKLFLADRDIIPALLGIMSPIGSEHTWKEEAVEILISLIQASQPSDYQTNPTLQELHSEHNIHVFLKLTSTSTPKIRATSLQLLLTLVHKSDAARSQIRSDPNTMTCLLSILQGDHQSVMRLRTLNLIHCITDDGIPLLASSKESVVTALITIFTSSPSDNERSEAAAIISQLPQGDATVDDMLRKSEALKAIHQVITGAVDEHPGMTQLPLPATASSSLLENVLGVLLRYTEPSNTELQGQATMIKLYPSLIRVLSTGSPLAKQRTALALDRLSQSTNLSNRKDANREQQLISSFFLLQRFTEFLRDKSWCCSSYTSLQKSLCSVHGSTCSSQHAFCLIRANAVTPLVQTLRERECGAADAALTALKNLLLDDDRVSAAITEIIKSQGVDAILHVMERGSVSAQEKALDIFLKILKHSEIRDTAQIQRTKRILVSQHLQVDELKKKAAMVLGEMGVIPQQSSYF